MTINGLFSACSLTATSNEPMCCRYEGKKKLTAIPANHGEIIGVRSELEVLLGLPQALELHGQLALLHLVVGERPQVGRETELVADPYEPLGRIVLIPLDSIAVVHRELVVEVVVPLAVCDERGDHMVARGVLVVKRRLPEPVCKGVDTER